MTRFVLAACAAAFACAPAAVAADPKPLWELAAPGGKHTAPAWLGFSPDGSAVVAVAAAAKPGDASEFAYTLKVWDAGSRQERFTADLGRGKGPTWGDDLVAFPTDDAVLTGGTTLVVRDLLTGDHRSGVPTYGSADHALWHARDLGETLHLNREPDREGKPIELTLRARHEAGYRSEGKRLARFNQSFDDESVLQADVVAPRAGLRPQSVALNPGRSRLVAAFRDDASGRHALVKYRINTVEEFSLDAEAVATITRSAVSALVFAPDGKTLATGGEDGTVCLWDVKDTESRLWSPRATIAAGTRRVSCVAFSPDWRTVAAVTWDAEKPNVHLIDADSGKLVRSVPLDRDVTAVAWSPDGRTLLTGGHSGRVCAWDAAELMK